ncbi:hypothetical protein N9937_00390 [bacterium]|nr:hypothetical protein [bacterium]
MERWFATLLAVDQLFNAMVNASPDETFSAACFRKGSRRGVDAKKRWLLMESLVNNLFFWDKEIQDGKKVKHCQLSWQSELARKHFPNEYKEREQ